MLSLSCKTESMLHDSRCCALSNNSGSSHGCVDCRWQLLALQQRPNQVERVALHTQQSTHHRRHSSPLLTPCCAGKVQALRSLYMAADQSKRWHIRPCQTHSCSSAFRCQAGLFLCLDTLLLWPT